MAQCHAKGPVGGTGRMAGKGLALLSHQDDINRKQRITAENQRIADEAQAARKRRIALVVAIGRLSFKRSTAIVNVSTADRKEGLELLCEQQGWTVTFKGDNGIVQKVPRTVFVRTTSESPRAA